MRMMVKVEWPVEAGNAAIENGSMPDTVQAILDEQKPEAAYFVAFNGKRTGLIFLDVPDPSHIPAVAEPWFLAFNASVDFYPAMNAEDLKKAGPAIEQAVKRYA
jgi:hypothetical protein